MVFKGIRNGSSLQVLDLNIHTVSLLELEELSKDFGFNKLKFCIKSKESPASSVGRA